jgi:hypothetical protein
MQQKQCQQFLFSILMSCNDDMTISETGLRCPEFEGCIHSNTSGVAAAIDPDGQVITGFIFADNYFELYVNGHLVAVDAVSFTSFNSSVARFIAKRPITYAVRLVDWKKNLGLGSENNRGIKYHAGDGGFVANCSDGTKTDSSCMAQTFYIRIGIPAKLSHQ